MPDGVHVEVDHRGFAVIDFVDGSLRGAGLRKLIDLGGPETVQTDTSGGRRRYVVPEGNARAAGLLDDPAPEGPTLDWSRQQLDEAARKAGIDPDVLPNKAAVLAVIKKIRNRDTR